MTVFELLTTEDAATRRKIVAASIAASLVNVAILAIVNDAARTAPATSLRLFVSFAVAVPLYLVCARYAFQKITEIFEHALHDVRLRVTAKLRRAELSGLEHLGTAEIYDRLSENMSAVAQSGWHLANVAQMATLVVFNGIYLATLSLPGLVITGGLLAAGVGVYVLKTRQTRAELSKIAETRLRFFDALTDLLRGAKEVRFSRARGDALAADLGAIAGSLRDSSLRVVRLTGDNTMVGQCTRYLVLGAAVFVVPQYFATGPELTAEIVSGFLFLYIPLNNVLTSYPAFVRADTALEKIAALEQKLDAAARTAVRDEDQEDPWGGALSRIEARDLGFSYAEGGAVEAFGVGPVSLRVAAGETLFIVGGNGSGKSTLLRLLTGLYPPREGALIVNGVLVRPENAQAYREMISAVLSDFHLFHALYGLPGVEEAAVWRLLRQMRLERRTSFARGRFSTLDLSTGQKKRLALVVTLLEDRPVIAFDEWAADQDPEFRRYFYEDLLPELRRRGKTLLVVTHDDRYFHLADRIVTMEAGKVRSIEAPRRPAGATEPLPPA